MMRLCMYMISGSKSSTGGDDEGAPFSKEEIELQKVEYQTQVQKVINFPVSQLCRFCIHRYAQCGFISSATENFHT